MKSLIVAAIFCASSWHCLASVYRIENANILVEYNDTAKTFSLTEKRTAKVFLDDGKLQCNPLTVVVEPAQDSVFGDGNKIVVTETNGSTISFELYTQLPFVLIRTALFNDSHALSDFQKVIPFKFMLNLDKAASELRTMGTAGLTAPDKNPGSYLFLTLADPETRRGIVAGWLTEDRGSGIIFSRVNGDKVEFTTQIDYGHLHIPVGKSEKLETFAIGIFDDGRLGEEAFANAIKEHYQIKLHPQVAGYCTWYSEVGGLTDKAGGAGSSNERDITTLTKYAARELKPFGFSFVQIDDGWQDGGTFNGPRRGFSRSMPNGPYPRGMVPVAEMIRSNSLTAGIWFLPFARNYQDPEYKNRQYWFMKRLDGKPYDTVWGGTSLDLTRPEVQDYLTELARTIHSWGFNYFKMDGLWTGSVTEQEYVNDGYKDDHIGDYEPFHDPSKTSIEALRDGLKFLRTGAGPGVFFSGCCASQNMRSLAGSIGLVDAMRIGPDNGFGWQNYHNETMHFEGGGIITGPIRANRLYFLNGRVWWNDPDPCYVRLAVKLNHAQLLASWMALSGMFNLDSDWLPGLSPDRLDILKRCMLPYRAIARPVDYFDSVMPSIWLTSDITNTAESDCRNVLGLYNWDGKTRFIGYDAAKSGLDGKKQYYAFDFWGNSPVPGFKGAFNYEVPSESCRVIAVHAAEGHPVLVSTSRHITQGIVDVSNEKWDANSSTLSGVSQVIGGDPYEIRVAGLNEGANKWSLISASVPPQATAEGVTTQTQSTLNEEEGWIRILITSRESRSVTWTLKFSNDNSLQARSVNLPNFKTATMAQ